jgi:hypothetical protein
MFASCYCNPYLSTYPVASIVSLIEGEAFKLEELCRELRLLNFASVASVTGHHVHTLIGAYKGSWAYKLHNLLGQVHRIDKIGRIPLNMIIITPILKAFASPTE